MKDIAYLAGCLRDGSLDRKRYVINITQKNLEWLLIIQQYFKKLFKTTPSIRKFRDCFELRICSKNIFQFFAVDLEIKKSCQETPEFIKSNKQLWIQYISGFFDAEGYCTSPQTYKRTGKMKISFYQNNLESLVFIKNVLRSFGIESGNPYLQNSRKCYALYIQSRIGILKFNEIFKPIRKKQNLAELVEIMTHEGTKAGSSRNEPQLSLAWDG